MRITIINQKDQYTNFNFDFRNILILSMNERVWEQIMSFVATINLDAEHPS